MPEYTVRYEIDICAASAVEAARAWEQDTFDRLADPNAIKPILEVRQMDRPKARFKRIDLEEIE